MSKRKPIPQKTKVRSELQKEIGSVCPFCTNEEVGHFEIHHIDEDPSNHKIENLILLCPTCQSKITKGSISQKSVVDIKTSLQNTIANIQFISVKIDEKNCGWMPIKESSNAFEVVNYKPLFPIFIFSLISNSNKTVLLTSIRTLRKNIPTGMSGPHIPLPRILRASAKYNVQLPPLNQWKETVLEDELEIPASAAFKFKIELFAESMDWFKPSSGKYAIFFELGFNNSFFVKVPMILLNSNSYYEKLEYRLMN